MSEGGNRPGILVSCCKPNSICWILQKIKKELSIRFDRVNSSRREKRIKVVIKPTDILRINDHHSPASGSNLDYFGLVLVRNLALRRDTTPVTHEGMPDSNMLDIWMCFAYFINGVLQALGKALFVRLKFSPAPVELRLTLIVQ